MVFSPPIVNDVDIHRVWRKYSTVTIGKAHVTCFAGFSTLRLVVRSITDILFVPAVVPTFGQAACPRHEADEDDDGRLHDDCPHHDVMA